MTKNCIATCHCGFLFNCLTMPVFKAVELRALLTCCGLIDSLMLSMPPLDVSNLSTTHLINMPGWKMFCSESISCIVASSDLNIFYLIDILFIKQKISKI